MTRSADRSYLFGDALFETVRVGSRGAFGLQFHIERFRRSAEFLSYPAASVAVGVRTLMTLANAEPGVWRVTVSRDDAEAPFGGRGGVTTARREPPAPRRPTLVSLVGWHFPEYSLAEHKTTSFVRYVEARRRAEEGGYDDALLIAHSGVVGEASTSNLFVVLQSGTIVTPEIRGILPGTSRARLLAAQAELGVRITSRLVEAGELEDAQEIILTNAACGAASAMSLDGRPLAESVGPVFRQFLLEER